MIFNVDKQAEDYYGAKIFGNDAEKASLLDTINKRFDAIWTLYKEQRVLDWSEDEFDFTQCIADFENPGNKTESEVMIEQIMFQWETDSVAAQIPFALIAPYGPCLEVIAAELRINENEIVHGATYSEIVKMAFKDPHEVLRTMLAHKHTHEKLSVVGTILLQLKKNSNALAYFGQDHFTDLEKTEHMILFYFVMYVLERLQFMASFGVTFTICQSGLFQAIGTAVKRICQDEFEVHCEYRLEVLRQLIATEHGKEAFKNVRPQLVAVLKETLQAEAKFAVDLFQDGKRAITGLNSDLLTKWSLFCGAPIAANFGITEEELGVVFPETNPLPHLENWIDINKTQTANQETNNGAYKVNVIDFDDAGVIYSI